MINRFFADTNIIIRLLTGEPKEQAYKARELFLLAEEGKISIIVDPIIIAEIIWVLSNQSYGISKYDLAISLQKFLKLDGVFINEENVINDALNEFMNNNVDYIDAYLSCLAKSKSNTPIVTWNLKHFKKMPSENYKPEEIISSINE